MSGDGAVYVYAVREPGLAADEELASLPGVGGGAVRAVAEGGLAAVVESVAAGVFNEESLRGRLEDLAWLEGVARAHHAVVAAAARHGAVVPVRLATVYTGDGNVRGLLRAHAAAFHAALDRIRGRIEWGVKAFLVAPRAEPRAQTPAASGPGTAYLMRRRAARDRAERMRRDAVRAADELHDRLSAMAVDARRYPPQDARLSGRSAEMLLNSAYLVDESAGETFRRVVADGDPRLALELTGPWAPYSFATLEGP